MARIVTTGFLRVSSSSLTTAFARSNAWTTVRDLSSLTCGVVQKMSPLELRQLRVSRNVSPLSYIVNSAIEPSQDEEVGLISIRVSHPLGLGLDLVT